MNRDDHSRTSIPAPDMPVTPSAGFVLDPKRFLWLRGPMVLAIALCIGIPAVLAAWFLVPVGYTANAEIRFLVTQPFVLTMEKTATSYTQFVNTQIGLITGTTVLSRVLDNADIRDIPSLAAESAPLEYLKKRVSARVLRGSEIVSVTCSMPDRDDARRVLEEVVSAYMNYAVGEEASAGAGRLAMLTQERDARQLELEAQLKKVRDLQSALGIPIVGETPLDTGEAQLYNERLAQAEEDLAKAQGAQTKAQAQIASIDGILEHVSKDKPVYEFGVEERVSADARVSVLRQEVVTIQSSLAGMAQLEQEKLPQRTKDEKRLESLREHLALVQLDVRREVLASIRTRQLQQLEMLADGVEEAQQRVEKFKQLVEGYRGRLGSTTDQFVQLEDLKAKAAETRGMLEAVRRSIGDISVESNAPGRVRIAAPATVPGGGPDYTPRLMLMAIALAASVGLALALGLWRELADQQVRSSQDLARLTLLPIIATIPHAREDSLPDSADMAHLIEHRPQSVLADAYRRVLARMLYPDMEQSEMRTLMVVSPTRGDGKSSLTSNLGVALARAGRRVLLVDLSYRRPTLEKHFDVSNGEGLAEILNGQTSAEQAIQSTRVGGLFVLGPGLDTDDLAGRLGSRDMAHFLEYAADQFDRVIIDTPAWLIMADAKLIAQLVGGVLVVVGSEASTLGMVRRCLRELDEVKANVVGLVLNGARSTVGGYMKKNRELYYGYGHDATSKSSDVMQTPADVPGVGSAGSGTEV